MRTLVTWSLTSLFVVQGAQTQAPSSAFFLIRPGQRSYVVSEPGRDGTRCADGASRSVCRVSRADFSMLKLREREQSRLDDAFAQGYAIVRATMGPTLVVTELWAPVTESRPLGDYYRVRDSDIRCIRAPCYSLSAERFGGGAATFSSLDLDALELSDAAKERALQAMRGGWLIVTGTVRAAHDVQSSSAGRTLVVTQLFRPVTAVRDAARPTAH